jgi:hypothetical protein
VLHRLCTYARGEALTGEQLLYLSEETKPQPVAAAHLVAQVEQQVQQTIQQLKATAAADLAGPRPVGRKALPSTVEVYCFMQPNTPCGTWDNCW